MMHDDTLPLDEVTISLDQYIDGRTRLHLEEALRLLASVAGVVALSHERGEIYGLLTPDRIEIQLGTGLCVGLTAQEPASPDSVWVAPEVFSGKPADSRSDIYALGILLRYLLTGSAKGNPRRLPDGLGAFYTLSTSADPGRRFQTVGMFLRRLGELQPRASELEREWAALNVSIRVRLATKICDWAGRQWVAICLALALSLIVGITGWRHYGEVKRFEAEQRVCSEAWTASERAYEEGRLRDAVAAYQHLMTLKGGENRHRQALQRLIECHRRLGDSQGELEALVRFVTLNPDSEAKTEYNARMIELTAEAITRYGGVQAIGVNRVMVVDGRPDDWSGIAPLVLDSPRDNRSGTSASDLVAAYAVVTGDTMVVRVDTSAAPDGQDYAYCLGVDVDPRTFTDTVSDWDYELAFSSSQAPWFWDLREGRTYENSKSVKLTGAQFAAGQSVEASFPLGAINSPRVFSLRFKVYSLVHRRDEDEMPQKIILSTALRPVPVPLPEAVPGQAIPAPSTDPQETVPGSR